MPVTTTPDNPFAPASAHFADNPPATPTHKRRAETLFLLGEQTVIDAIALLDPDQAHHVEAYILLHPADRGEVYTFRNGAKLVRMGSHRWKVCGYHYADVDTIAAAADFRAAVDQVCGRA